MKNIKSIILDRIIEKIEAKIKSAERARLDAIEESKVHKGAMESRYDTFKEEAQYLAGGFNAWSQELARILGVLKSIKHNPPTIIRCSGYAIVEAKNIDDGLVVRYFLLPEGEGGNTYEVEGKEITILNVGAPIARAFIGTIAGDEVNIIIRGRTKRFSVVSIS